MLWFQLRLSFLDRSFLQMIGGRGRGIYEESLLRFLLLVFRGRLVTCALAQGLFCPPTLSCTIFSAAVTSIYRGCPVWRVSRILCEAGKAGGPG